MVLKHYTEQCVGESLLDVRDHIAGMCASPISTPARRQHPSYRPINKPSDDPYLLSTPKRGSRNPSPTKRQSPVKRSIATGEVYPPNEQDPTPFSAARTGPHEPIESFINKQDAQRAMASFRSAAETRGSCCAISGVGEGWVNGMVVGPGIHACHIVPQSAWDLYPLPEDEGGDVEDSSLNSPRRWQKKWESTWAGENAVWVQSSLHDAHDGRIVAIHPKSWKIRSFAPYNLVLPYHNNSAYLSLDYPPDHRALKHQWESCVIENMTAKNPWRAPISLARSPSEWEPMSVGDTEGRSSPTKRQRPLTTATIHEGGAPDTSNALGSSMDRLTGHELDSSDINCISPSTHSMPELDMANSETTTYFNESFNSLDNESTAETDEAEGKSSRKRRFSVDEDYSVRSTSHLTPENAQYFLADVNWELKRRKHS